MGAASIPGRDVFVDLLRDTRGLRREQSQARDAWFARLGVERKEELLFELEILLKGLACFANPRNHPGPSRRHAVVAQDFREALVQLREAMKRIVHLSRLLLAEREKAFVFHRYLETLVPDDGARRRLHNATITQDTPEESLFVLRHAMTNLHEVTIGLARLQRVPFRSFYALASVAHREVSQSAYFNPLTALEFRPEFDRITSPHILELTRAVQGEQARRLVALTFLALFRMLRYLTLIKTASARDADNVRKLGGVVYPVMAVLRSDARALTGYLRQRAGALLSDSYERSIFKVKAPELRDRYEGLLAEGVHLLGMKATLGCVASNVRLEIRRAFERDFPSPDDAPTAEGLVYSVQRIEHNLRPALQNAILFLGKSLGTRLDEHGVFSDEDARRTLSERLRRDVWMFAQIVRAFAVKARAVSSSSVEDWTGVSPLQFVREFLAYFRAMGYPLLRAADYPRFDAFLAAMNSLEESHLFDPKRLEHATNECDHFHSFLLELFDRIGKRSELQSAEFDRRGAAAALKMYLGERPND
jgi:hypothetical protein